MTTNIWHHKTVLVFTVIRILAAVSILLSPLWGFALSVIFDILDGRFIVIYGHVDKLAYDLWDKILDSVTFVAELAVVMSSRLAYIFVLLFVYRMIGHIVLWITKKPQLLVFFPNFFEAMFFWFLIPVSVYSTWMSPMFWLIFLLILKLVHELFMHWFWQKYISIKWERLVYTLFGRKSKLTTFLSTTFTPRVAS